MKRKSKDRPLDTPSEGIRDKHINFIALENDEQDPSDQPATGKLAAIYQKINKKKVIEPGTKKGKLPGAVFLGHTIMTLFFCGFVYLLMLKAVALLLTIA